MNSPWLPQVLKPDFIWPPRPSPPLSTTIPATPQPSHPLIRRFWGLIHTHLKTFSYHYCYWLGFPFDNQIAPLPFGLLLKWSDGTRLEEVLATQLCRAAGLPVPRILNYGDHPETPHAPVSILMTRLPGREMGQVYESLSDDAKAAALAELKMYLATIRQWKSPWGDVRICSITGGPIRSIRVPNHIVGPYETSEEFHDYLLAPAWKSSSFKSQEDFEAALQRARRLRTLERPGVKFTHGDLKHHNILVDEGGHVTGFLDWEAAGWYPEFWEYTTAMRYLPAGNWWYELLLELGAEGYRDESDCERALTNLTVDSWVF